MIKLEIKKQDDSIYWTEHFDDFESAEAWILEEETRKYWNKSYVAEIKNEYRTIVHKYNEVVEDGPLGPQSTFEKVRTDETDQAIEDALDAAKAQRDAEAEALKLEQEALKLALKDLKVKAKDKTLKADEIQAMLEGITELLGL